ncbi:MAG: glutathione S-transferase family protein [Proteobacteria bacterium]|nr:glutathione S-transferase family protein [Pseudomonadota bacterium]
MKLYVFPVAPNPTRVRLFIAEKRAGGAELPIEEVMVNVREGEQNAPEHRARNPFARLPVLELDDGRYLLESLVIMEYLEELAPEPRLVGATPLERARVRQLERIAEQGVLQVVSRIVHATNSPLGLAPNPELAAHYREQLPGALGYLEGQLADGRPFVAGERPTSADCTLQAAFQFARFGKVEIDPAYEHLARWSDAYRARSEIDGVLLT